MLSVIRRALRAIGVADKIVQFEHSLINKNAYAFLSVTTSHGAIIHIYCDEVVHRYVIQTLWKRKRSARFFVVSARLHGVLSQEMHIKFGKVLHVPPLLNAFASEKEQKHAAVCAFLEYIKQK